MKRFIYAAAALAMGPLSYSAHADTLTLTVAADNAYALYISPSDATLGTLITGSNTYGGPAGQWSTATTYSVDLSPASGSVYYLHVIGSNYTTANGEWSTPGTLNGQGDNPDGFIGHFSLAGSTNFQFGNSSTELDTNTTNWSGIAAPDNSNWILPTAAAQSFGQNGVGPWGSVGGPTLANAFWIWSNPDTGGYADLSTEIFFVGQSSVTATPLPAALPMFASGLGALGMLHWRRKRKTA